MSVITVDDWTGKLVGTNETDFSLRSAGGVFMPPGNWHAHGGSAMFHVHGAEGAGNALDTVASYHVTPSAWAAAGAGMLADTCIQNSWTKVSAVPQLSCAANFTAEFWFKTTNNFTVNGYNLHRLARDGYNRPEIRFYSSSVPGTNIYTYVRDDDGNPSTGWLTTTGMPLATPTHICIERYGNTGYFFVNGVVKATKDLTAADNCAGLNNVWAAAKAAGDTAWFWQDIYGAQTAEHGGTNFSPHVFEVASVVTGATAFDSGSAGNLWSSVTVTCPARTSNETYALHVAANETGVPPAIGGTWTQVATGLTGTSTQGFAATGRYLFFKTVHTPDTGAIQQYQIKIDTVAATWTSGVMSNVPISTMFV